MGKQLDYFKNLIEEKGYKFTVQKKIILKVLIDSSIHLNAEEIYNKIKKDNIGIATVYRNLKIFEKLGIVKDLNINGVNYYEMKIFSGKPLHIHFKCLKCNSIIDIDNSKLDLEYLKLSRFMEHSEDLEIHDANILFLGLCSKCKEEEKCQDQQSLEE
ncbi:Fur family transcriptional regulator [Clostridium sporogenes]|uniref:Fur family transcriptional regulator n=1 Tax=Clostridium sporogenes TaxID=1509 RepID=A0A7X5P9W1_CLOSG|nr:Fur family transcriptional regulator [Clostridium sporogenes]AJD29481.1 ferric uptake regulator family protein [Clostridium botulinum Prevot_594]AVP59471.1 transcriptional repressor [Clostridium botulinum]AKC62135.1 Fur family transcriptional regulator [Clostridium sporogenes]AKJ89419.1 Fur family transcriptional regulator [Clostridium sporogenes]EHN16187.1 Fur family transcriptional regulator [Clostridium sporogenes PA 3679]